MSLQLKAIERAQFSMFHYKAIMVMSIIRTEQLLWFQSFDKLCSGVVILRLVIQYNIIFYWLFGISGGATLSKGVPTDTPWSGKSYCVVR